ncbi:pyridoxamine 5 -phosphate oxidase isoform B [Micractinium conductrix]|nr:pyridoxamine 5 -phosphate oxidase isoform B [Micractinium conductrix]|eukprot:PSC70073.1 pyridoxamine 5 -phosphate oxidase isoform B [Micractinium conductrix]
MAEQAPWREVLQRALKKNSNCRHSRYVQLATVRPDGRPANRTVVYRGFLGDGLGESLGETDVLTFVTDCRSNKVGEIAHNPWAEVAWYFPDTREQFRLLGKLSVVNAATADEKLQKGRRAAWKTMSDPGRQQFMWPQPGEPRGGDDSIFKPEPPSADSPVLDAFCLVCLAVEEVDHIQLAKNLRHRYLRGGGGGGEWASQNVNP